MTPIQSLIAFLQHASPMLAFGSAIAAAIGGFQEWFKKRGRRDEIWRENSEGFEKAVERLEAEAKRDKATRDDERDKDRAEIERLKRLVDELEEEKLRLMAMLLRQQKDS